MPHIVLEYSDNSVLREDASSLFDRLHQLLAAELQTTVANCKSRCVVYPVFFIGEQTSNKAFVHMTIKILPGREASKKKQVAETVLALLKDYFYSVPVEVTIDYSVELADLDPSYSK